MSAKRVVWESEDMKLYEDGTFDQKGGFCKVSYYPTDVALRELARMKLKYEPPKPEVIFDGTLDNYRVVVWENGDVSTTNYVGAPVVDNATAALGQFAASLYRRVKDLEK